MNELLDKLNLHGADQELIELVKREKLATLISLMCKLSEEERYYNVYWIKNALSLSPYEDEIYELCCHITDSTDCYKSNDIIKSAVIIDSSHVNSSRQVFHAKEIDHSSMVVSSSYIENSSQVYHGFMIQDSKKIQGSLNVIKSTNIIDSSSVFLGQNIFNSKDVYESGEIFNSKGMTNSYFCNNCSNLKESLFCASVNDDEHLLFNKKVDKNRITIYLEQYKRIMKDIELSFVKEWPENLIETKIPKVNHDFSKWFVVVPQKVWRWAETLPGFDPYLLFGMTQRQEFLKMSF